MGEVVVAQLGEERVEAVEGEVGGGGLRLRASVGSMERRIEMSFSDLEDGRPAGVPPRRGGCINGRLSDPSQVVASGIFQITTAVSTFQRLVNTNGAPKDTSDLREKLFVSLADRYIYTLPADHASVACWGRQAISP